MNKKLIFTMLIFLIVVVSCYFVIKKELQSKKYNIENRTEVSEKITDDCTDEYINQIEETKQASSEEEKVSPNCEVILKKYFKNCGHTTNAYIEIPDEIVNMTKRQIEDKYTDWKVEEFSSNKIVLYKEIEGSCGEHYEIKSDKNKVIVYSILDSGDKMIYEITGISIEYLTDSDKQKLQDGIKVNGNEKLNEILEDFE